jgi:hypothetical protein
MAIAAAAAPTAIAAAATAAALARRFPIATERGKWFIRSWAVQPARHRARLRTRITPPVARATFSPRTRRRLARDFGMTNPGAPGTPND